MSEHWCKTAEPYYSDVEKGIKPFEVRIDDRFPAYAVGDTLHLQQFTGGKLTGRECARTVTYALRDPAYVKDGYVVLGIMPLEDASSSTARELSLEELEQMHGQPVWLKFKTEEVYCRIIESISDDRWPYARFMGGESLCLCAGHLGKTYWAYTAPPKEG